MTSDQQSTDGDLKILEVCLPFTEVALMQQEIAALRSALAFYAAPRNWDEGGDPAFVKCQQDRGWTARMLLDLPLKPTKRQEKAVDEACTAIARKAVDIHGGI